MFHETDGQQLQELHHFRLSGPAPPQWFQSTRNFTLKNIN